MPIYGRGQMTLTDMNDVVASLTKPTNPIEGTMWFSIGESLLYIYTGGKWILSSEGIDFGGRNMLRLSDEAVSTTSYSMKTYTLTQTLLEGEQVTIQLKGALGAGKTNFGIYNSGGMQSLVSLLPSDRGSDGIFKKTFNWSIGSSSNTTLVVYQMPSGTTATSSIEWIKLERGNVASDYTAAPEDNDDKVSEIMFTLGNMANDNLIEFNERKVIKDKITDIIGYVMADTTTTLPTVATMDAGTSGKGTFFFVRKNAQMAGLSVTDVRYVALKNAWDNATTGLKVYLESLPTVKPWDLSSANSGKTSAVTKATFRDRWLKYYQAELDLANATAEKLKKNVDDVAVGGANYGSNGNFIMDITKSLWSASYAGQLKERVDISTETPPFQYAYHVKNTSNANGGIFSPTIWSGTSAEALVDKEITIQFWLKYSGITVGASAFNAGRFGELVITGENASGTKYYRYPRATLANVNGADVTPTETLYITGTDTVWKKYVVTHKLSLPTGATKLTRVEFKHGLEACVGEFWTTGLKIEIGNKATDWSVSDLDTEQRFSSVEFKISDSSIVSTVTSSEAWTLETAKIKNSTDTIADMMSDLKITPIEKSRIKTTWDEIQAKNTQLLALATSLAVSTTAFTAAFNALNTTAPRIQTDILANMTTTYTLTTTTRDNFKAQLNTFFVEAEKLHKAVSDKINATATAAKQGIDDIINDMKVTPTEKLELQRHWQKIQAQYTELNAQAVTLGVDSTIRTNYTNAYNALNTTTPRIQLDILASMTTTYNFASTTARDTFKAQLNTYFVNAEKISRANVDSVQSYASRVEQKADSITSTVSGINTRLGQAESKITQTADSITNKVWSTDISKAVDDVEIGGRNLAIATNSENWSVWGASSITFTDSNGVKSIKATRTGTSAIGVQQSGSANYTTLKLNEQYTLSFKIRGSVGQRLNYVFIMNTDTGNQNVSSHEAISSETEYQQVEITFTKNTNAAKSYVMISTTDGATGSWIEVKDVKIEKGNKATDWTPAPEDIDNEFGTIKERLSSAELKITPAAITSTVTSSTSWINQTTAIGTAQTAANNAGTAAGTANSLLDDMKSDMKVTPLEKNNLKTTWEAIKAEYTQLVANASALSVSSTAYVSAYNSIKDTTPRIELDILANMSTTYSFASTTARDTFRNQVNGYYTQSETLQKAIRDKIQSNANTALINAGTANTAIGDMSSDMKITPLEKNNLKTTWESMKAEYTQLTANASALSVSATNYINAYNAILNTTPKIEAEVLASMTTTYSFGSTALRDTFRTQFNTYFTQAETLQKAVRDKIQSNASAAQGTATTANNTANTLRDTTIPLLTQRVSSAEQKIEPDKITQTVRQSTDYGNDLAAKAGKAEFDVLNQSTGNLVNNPVVTGNANGWSDTTLDTQDFLGTSIHVLKNVSSSHGYIYSDYFYVDPAKMYEVSVWMKKSQPAPSATNAYLGLNVLNASGSTIAVNPINNATGTLETDSTNFYFWNRGGTTNLADWEKVTGYILPSGFDPLKAKEISNASRHARMLPHTKRIRVRLLNYNNATIGTAGTMWMAHPKVVEVPVEIAGRITDAESKITQQSEEISLRVKTEDFTGNAVASLINQTATTIKILAKNIELQGQVSFTMLDSTTQNRITTVESDATTVKNAVADMASDLKITPLEKNNLKTTWESMKAEYLNLLSSAGSLGVSATACTTAYNAIKDTAPRIELDILASMTTTYTFSGTAARDTFRNQINAYFTQSEALGKAITDKVQSNASAAGTAAGNANSAISDMSSDLKVTPVEKIAMKTWWEGIKSRYSTLLSEANIHTDLSSYVMSQAYAALATASTPRVEFDILNSMTTTYTFSSTTVRDAFNTRIKTLYDEMDKLSSQITVKLNTNVNNAKAKTDAWTFGNKTTINGGMIEADSMKVIKLEVLQINGGSNQIYFGGDQTSFEGRIDYADNGFRFQSDASNYYKVNKGGSSGSTVTAADEYVHQMYAKGSPMFNFGLRESFNHRFLRAGQNIAIKFLNGGTGIMQIKNPADTAYMPIQAADYLTGSKREYKENIVLVDRKMSDLVEITPVYEYMFKGQKAKKVGFMWEESPEEIREDDSVSNMSISGVLWKSQQEQIQEIKDLKMRLEKLEGKGKRDAK